MKFRIEAILDLFIRIPVGFHLIYGVIDNIISNERMVEFQLFLENNGLPFPIVGAFVSVYSQFIAGILFVIGWKIKWAGAIMIANFSVAIILVHLDDPYVNVFPAIWMLSASIFLTFNNLGPISIDGFMRSRQKS